MGTKNRGRRVGTIKTTDHGQMTTKYFLENRKFPSIGNSEGHHPPVQGEPNNIIAKAKGGGL